MFSIDIYYFRVWAETKIYTSGLCAHTEVVPALLVDSEGSLCHYKVGNDTNVSEYYYKCDIGNEEANQNVTEHFRHIKVGQTVLMDRANYSCD